MVDPNKPLRTSERRFFASSSLRSLAALLSNRIPHGYWVWYFPI